MGDQRTGSPDPRLTRASAVLRDSPLWAVTCFFGADEHSRRLANYRAFRRHLPVPLATIEMSFGARLGLQGDDADILIGITDGDVLWQKERLLNLAIESLPQGCRYVAWLDSDVIIRGPDWPTALCQLLDDYPIAQLFEHVLDCPREIAPEDVTAATAGGVSHSFAWRWQHHLLTDQLRVRGGTRIERDCATGIAWAARRELLAGHGLYDACIAGAGDRAMNAAMVGRYDDAVHALRMTAPFAAHYLDWARSFNAAVHGRVGCLPGEVVHLWHGAPRERNHGERHRVLQEHAYDPLGDIVRQSDGTWRLAGNKPGLRQFFRGYFAARAAQAS